MNEAASRNGLEGLQRCSPRPAASQERQEEADCVGKEQLLSVAIWQISRTWQAAGKASGLILMQLLGSTVLGGVETAAGEAPIATPGMTQI